MAPRGRPRSDYPVPGKRRRGENWEAYWWKGADAPGGRGRTYGVNLGPVTEPQAEVKRALIAAALAGGEWPAEFADAPGVLRYMHRNAPAAHALLHPGTEILGRYGEQLATRVHPRWAATSLTHLRALAKFTGKPLVQTTAADAEAWLTSIPNRPGTFRKAAVRSYGTANHARAAASRFFRWALEAELIRRNPFASTKPFTVQPPETITYLTREQRDNVLAAARQDPKGIAVELALLAGLRKSELARARWSDLTEHGRLRVQGRKTARPRLVPLPRALLDRLAALRPADGRGSITGWPNDPAEADWRAEAVLRRLQDGLPDVPAVLLAWNSFRHTFATLLVQSGVSLDKVSAWMGNSPAICRRHYAEFVPRDARDEDIEKL